MSRREDVCQQLHRTTQCWHWRSRTISMARSLLPLDRRLLRGVPVRISSALLIGVATVSITACSGREGPIGPIEVTSPSPAGTTAPASANVAVRVDFEGKVSGLIGTCPSLQFTAGGRAVTTSASTTVRGGCSAIVNSAPVLVSGVRQSDGSVSASAVIVREVEATGAIGALQGSCPAITFTLGSTAVSTSASTNFAHDTCSQLANGGSATAVGYTQSDGSIAASAVASHDGGQP